MFKNLEPEHCEKKREVFHNVRYFKKLEFPRINLKKKKNLKKIYGKTSNSTKIVCEIANSLQKKVVHQDSNLTQKFGLRRVFCFLAYQAGKSARVACVRQILGVVSKSPPRTWRDASPPPTPLKGGEPLIKARLFRTKSNLKKQICN